MRQFLSIVIAILLTPTLALAAECDNVRKDSEIVLVLWSADDCGYCRKWKSPRGGKGDLKAWPDFNQIIYREVARPLRASSLAAEHFPADLKWLLDQRARAGQWRTGPVPAWTIYVDKVEVEQAYGLTKWDAVVFPLLKELVAEKAALQEPASAQSKH